MPKTTKPRKPHGLTGRPSNRTGKTGQRKPGARRAALYLRVTDEQIESLDALAEKLGVTRSAVAVVAIEAGIEGMNSK